MNKPNKRIFLAPAVFPKTISSSLLRILIILFKTNRAFLFVNQKVEGRRIIGNNETQFKLSLEHKEEGSKTVNRFLIIVYFYYC